MILADSCSCTGNIGVFSYLVNHLRASPPFTVILYGSYRLDKIVFTVGLRTHISFTDFNRKLYGYGIQAFLLCVLSIALSVTSVLIADCSVASNLCAVLPVALTIVHFDGKPIHSLHSI